MTRIRRPSFWLDACRSVRFADWLILCIPFLILALAYDRYGEDYEVAREVHVDTAFRLERAHAMARLASRLQDRLSVASPSFDAVARSAYQNEELQASSDAMVHELSSILEAIYVKPDKPMSVDVNSISESIAVLVVPVEFTAVPQQLYGLEMQILARNGKLTVSDLNVQVIPDPSRNSRQLKVSVVIKAIHIKSSVIISHAAHRVTTS